MKNLLLLEIPLALHVFNWSNQFYNLIQECDIITLFRHESPDGDAYGSSLGLKHFLIENYPTKQVYMVSAQTGSQHSFFEDSDFVSDDIIANSLAIVLDTANSPRIDDARFKRAQKIVKIDHHPGLDQYGDYNFVEETYSSTCEIIATLLLEKYSVLSQKVSRYLYAGMLTDTVSFSINSVTSETLSIASKLVASGIKIGDIHNELFVVSDNLYDYITYLRQHTTETEFGLIYCYVEQETLRQFNLSVTQAKEVVNVFKEKASAQIWMLFIKEESGYYRTTMRSREITINDIARDFGGGGHRLAAATRDLSYDQTQQLIKALSDKLDS